LVAAAVLRPQATFTPAPAGAQQKGTSGEHASRSVAVSATGIALIMGSFLAVATKLAPERQFDLATATSIANRSSFLILVTSAVRTSAAAA
jgi:hypothetical protein